MRHLKSLLTVVAVLSTGPAHAGDITWTGAGDGTSFGNPLNWSPISVPGQFDTAIFNNFFPLVSLGPSVENERLSVLQCLGPIDGSGVQDARCQIIFQFIEGFFPLRRGDLAAKHAQANGIAQFMPGHRSEIDR